MKRIAVRGDIMMIITTMMMIIIITPFVSSFHHHHHHHYQRRQPFKLSAQVNDGVVMSKTTSLLNR